MSQENLIARITAQIEEDLGALVTGGDAYDAACNIAQIVAPRTITTAEELEEVPEGSILEASGSYYGSGTFSRCHVRKVPQFVHKTTDAVFEVLVYGSTFELAKEFKFPVTVLWEPQS